MTAGGDPRLPGPRHASGSASPPLTALTPGKAGAHRAPTSRRTWLLLALAAVTVGTVVIALVIRPGTSEPPAGGSTPPQDDAVWADIVHWTDSELPADTRVTVPADDLPALAAASDTADDAAGDPASDTGRFAADEPAGALLLLESEPPDGATTLARFEAADGTALTLVDPAPGQPTADELGRRRRLAAAILANPQTGATGRAADVLQSGEVDPRLLGLLAVLVTQLGIGVADFPPAPGEPDDGPLARHVLLDRAGTAPVGSGRPATDDVLTFLDAQLPPFAPDDVEVDEAGILVAFRYVSSPDAVVTASTP